MKPAFESGSVTPSAEAREKMARAERENTAKFVFQALQALPHPADAAAVLATVHAALIFTQRVRNEQDVRAIMAKLTEITVDMWKVQVEAMKARQDG